jgi:hypothetical protein
MRRAVLLRSIQRILGEDVVIRDAAYVWSRHRWVVPYAALVFVAITLLAPVAGLEEWPSRVVLGLAGVGIAVTATTTYRVIAETGEGIVILSSSRIRQVATALESELSPEAPIEPVGGTLLAADWRLDATVYTVARSSEQAMQRMAERRSARS